MCREPARNLPVRQPHDISIAEFALGFPIAGQVDDGGSSRLDYYRDHHVDRLLAVFLRFSLNFVATGR
jgi:hypothetical protein